MATLTMEGARPDSGAYRRVLLLLVASTVLGAFLNALTFEKTTFLYKDQLGLSPGQVGTLNLIVGIPSYLQPFIGAWADLVPLFGYHRRSYYLLSSLIFTAGYLCLGLVHHYQYATVIGLILILAAGGVVSSVIVNAVMVAVGNATGTFARLQSILGAIPLVLSIVYTAHLSGYVTQHWTYQHAFLTAAALSLLYLPLVFVLDDHRVTPARHVQETPEDRAAREAARREDQDHTRAALRDAARSPGLWAVVGFVFYLILTPGIYTAQVYYETDVLGFSKQFIGDLGMWGSAGALVGGAAFFVAARRMPVRGLVWGAWLMDALGYPALLLLHSPRSAEYLTLFNGCVGVLYGLCLNTLAARATPAGIEGTVYGLVMATIAFAGVLSEKIGGTLYDFFGPTNPAHHYTTTHGWQMSLWVGLAFTLVGFVFIPFLPAWAKSREPIPVGTDAS